MDQYIQGQGKRNICYPIHPHAPLPQWWRTQELRTTKFYSTFTHSGRPNDHRKKDGQCLAMASSPRPANLNLSGGVNLGLAGCTIHQTQGTYRVQTNTGHPQTCLPTHSRSHRDYLPCGGGVFHCTLTKYASSMLHKQTTNAMQCQEDPGSQALMASPSQNWRHTCQCTPCAQNIQSSVQGKTEAVLCPMLKNGGRAATRQPRASKQALTRVTL